MSLLQEALLMGVGGLLSAAGVPAHTIDHSPYQKLAMSVNRHCFSLEVEATLPVSAFSVWCSDLAHSDCDCRCG